MRLLSPRTSRESVAGELLAYRGEIDPGVPLDDRVAARGPRRPASPAARRLHSGHRARERRGGHAYAQYRPAPRPPDRGRQRRQLDGPQGGAGAARRTGPPPPRPGHAPPRRPGRRRAAYTERVRGRLAVLGDRVVHHGVLNRTASPASTVALTSSCCPAGGNVRHGLRRGPGRWPAGRRVAGWQPASPRQRRSRGSGPRPERYPGPRRRTRPAGQRRGVAGRRGAGGGAAEALRCRDGATPRQHSSRPSRS